MRIVLLGLLLCVPLLCHGQQATQASDNNTELANSRHFVSDDLYIYLHAGPGRNYRILGSLQAGVRVLKTEENESNDFVEVIDAEGRKGWIEVEFLATGTSRRTQVIDLREQVADANAKVLPLQQQLRTLQAENTQLSGDYKKLEQQLIGLQRELSVNKQKIATNQHEEEMRTLIIGGGLVAGGALLGVILVYLPKKRKRNDGWIN